MAELNENELFDKKFSSRDELEQEVRCFYIARGYALSIRSSKKDEFVDLRCDRSGCYRDRSKTPSELRKKTTTRLMNCPFRIRGRRLENGLWALVMGNNSHNHEASIDMSGHPSCRRLSKKEIEYVANMSAAGVSPRHILLSLRESNPNLQAISRTIYNLKAKIRNDKLRGRTPIQALFEELEEGGFGFKYLKDDDGYLTHVFFIHPKSIALARTFSTVFVMDCTYKTNKYGMPLLDIIGMSSFNKSFYSGFAFLRHETTNDYIWALEQFRNVLGAECQPAVIVTDRDAALINGIEVVFPSTNHLLCVWHIEKNIVANCKEHFKEAEDWDLFMSMWRAVMYAETEDQFDETWDLFRHIYAVKKDVISYIQSTWISEKEKFVSAWTEKHIHFGNRASSRAEGAHSKLKKYLQVSTGNLHQVKNKICLAIENEYKEIKTQLESERLRIPHKYNIPFFSELINNVSIFALGKLYMQFEMFQSGTTKPICTGHFKATMGLPCSHEMCGWKESALSLQLVHSQWRIDTKVLTSSSVENEINEQDDVIETKALLDKLFEVYQQWPTFQRLEVKRKIYRLLNMEEPLIRDPKVHTRKRRKGKSKKGKGLTSTTRDPSQFEIVEAQWKSTRSQNIGETSSIGIDLNSLP